MLPSRKHTHLTAETVVVEEEHLQAGQSAQPRRHVTFAPQKQPQKKKRPVYHKRNAGKSGGGRGVDGGYGGGLVVENNDLFMAPWSNGYCSRMASKTKLKQH